MPSFQYIPLRDFDDVNDALSFNTADCQVIGGCDLYTTKAAGDKKLYNYIEQQLEAQYASLLKFSAGLSASHAVATAGAAGPLNLSRASPFGSLSLPASRRTFAYLIATLNASHPDYDFSHVLRPSDFRREPSLKRVLNTLDTTLYNLRPRPSSSFSLTTGSSWSSGVSSSAPPPSPGKEIWNPRMWQIIDKDMSLEDCSIYRYAPEEDPYDGDDGAIWSFNYFFYNKSRKRVCYVYLRGLSILSHGSGSKTPTRTKKRSLDLDSGFDEPTSAKRARYWLGDRAADATSHSADDDEEPEVRSGTKPKKPNPLEHADDPHSVTEEDPHSQMVFSADEATSPSSPSAFSTERSCSESTVRAAGPDVAESAQV